MHRFVASAKAVVGGVLSGLSGLNGDGSHKSNGLSFLDKLLGIHYDDFKLPRFPDELVSVLPVAMVTVMTVMSVLWQRQTSHFES